MRRLGFVGRGRGWGQGRGLGFILLLQLYQQYQRIERKPPVTIALIIINLLVYFSQGDYLDISTKEICLQPYRILMLGEWWRIITAGFFHVDEIHLYYNMSSLLMKGLQIEQSRGSVYFALMAAELLIVSHSLVVATTYIGISIGMDIMYEYFWSTCAIGFSAVLFGFKYVLTFGREGTSEIHIPLYGIVRFPSRLFVPSQYLAF
eukprot:TRINITY_DN11246_c0_g1_i1.p1 TRINITY_DN11246_c0_g1~~TRINITY_DN11246_c0_g1_i1.p1  ORF type:complete len:220 (+),score=4.60 TRINITY_DN11246_c0_g1_i1:47-661(+)